jgi:Bacterial Ig-like domain (group 3)
MRLKLILIAALAAVAGIAIPAAVPAAAAQAATTVVTLPITQYSHMLIDPVHQHLFITSGAGSDSILVTDYSGQTVATIPNEPGATGLALSGDGSTVYAALAGGDAISAISTSTLAETARYSTGANTGPTYVAYTSGKIWFGYNGTSVGNGGIGSIDPSTSPATVTLNATPDSWYSAPMVTASADGELVAGEPGQSPIQLASYDVSSGTATVLAPQQFVLSASNLNSFQITPDGADVVTASGAPSYQQVFTVSDLAAAGTYPTTNYPNSVSISSNGSVAAGTFSGTNAIFVFAPDSTTPVNTFNFGSNWLAADGAALTPDGSELFAVTLEGGPTGTPQLNIIINPLQAPTDPTTTGINCTPAVTAGPATVAIGQATTCTATVTDISSVGATTPTGTVGFTSDTSGGTFTDGGSCTLASTGVGQSACSLSYTPGQLGSGTQTITASYSGDADHGVSSGQTAIAVTLRTTSTSLTCSPATVFSGQATTCTATVTDAVSGSATTPAGSVSFITGTHKGNFTAVGSCTLAAVGVGQASCSITFTPPEQLPLGTQQVAATYVGDSEHFPSGAQVAITVTPGPAALLAALYQSVTIPTPVGPGNSLGSKVQQAQAYYAAGDVADTCGTLGAFVNEVAAQTGKMIPALTAAQLTAAAQQIQVDLGC